MFAAAMPGCHWDVVKFLMASFPALPLTSEYTCAVAGVGDLPRLQEAVIRKEGVRKNLTPCRALMAA